MTGHLRAAEKRVVAAVAEDRDALVALVSDLVARPSVTGEEAPAAAGVRDWLQAHGFDVIEQVIDPNSEVARRFPAERNLDARPNVVVRWEPAGHVAGSVRRRIVLNGHLDVVPAGDEVAWTHPPFAGVVADGRIWGRGTADMKAGLAVAMFALHCLRRAGITLDYTLELQAVVGEESGGIGTAAMLEHTGPPDAAVVLEPTGNRVITAAGGAQPFSVEVDGIAAHVSTPWEGVSAFEKLTLVYQRIMDFWSERERRVTHPLFRALPAAVPTSVGHVRAGSWRLTLPEQALLQGRIGALPDEDLAVVRRDLTAALRQLGEQDDWLAAHPVRVRWDGPGFPGWETDPESALANSFLTASRDLGHGDTPGCVTYGTDASAFAGHGSEVLLFGPGDVAQAHTRDEWVAVDQVVQACQILCVALIRLSDGLA